MVPKGTLTQSFRMYRGDKNRLIICFARTTVIDWYFSEEDLTILNIAGKSFWRIFFKEPVPYNSIDIEINMVYEDGFEVSQEQVILL